MKAASSKDYFAILGVEPTAAPEEIRKAYLDRAREIHPDRFDLRTQPTEWRQANDALAELNEAYAALRSAAGWVSEGERKRESGQSDERDHWGWEQAGAETRAAETPAFDLGELAPGEACFDELPRDAQTRLLARQKGLIQDQWKIGRHTPLSVNMGAIVVLMGWFLYLFIEADRSEWALTALIFYTVVTTFVGLLIGRNLMTLLRWTRSTLKPALYLTPLYYVKTGFDVVSFFPLWTLGSISGANSRKAFSPRGVEVKIEFGPHLETLRFASRRAAEEFERRLKTFERGFRQAFESGRMEYIREHDDFYSVRRHPRAARATGNRFGEYFALVLPLLASWILFVLAVDQNMKGIQERLIRYPDPISIPQLGAGAVEEIQIDQARSMTGELAGSERETGGFAQSLGSASTIGPNAGRQDSQDPSPVSVTHGEQLPTFGDSKGFLPRTGSSGGRESEPLGDSFRVLQPIPIPLNGHLTRSHDTMEAVAPFEIKLRDTNRHLFLILEDWETGGAVLTVFIRSGQTVKFDVPVGGYRLKYVAGKKWYGERHLFGGDGIYGGSGDRMDFTKEGDKVTGRKVELALRPEKDSPVSQDK